MTPQIILMSAMYLGLALTGQALFKRAANNLDSSSLLTIYHTYFLNLTLWIAIFSYFFAMFFWVWLLKSIDLSRLFPIMSSILLVAVPLMSAYLLHETLSLRYWAGVALMLGGIVLIATEMQGLK